MSLARNLRNQATFLFFPEEQEKVLSRNLSNERERANGEWQSCVLGERFLLSAFWNSLSCKEERERDLSFSLFLKWVVSSSSCYKTHLKQGKKVTVFLYLCNVLISKKKNGCFGGFLFVFPWSFCQILMEWLMGFGELIIWREGF